MSFEKYHLFWIGASNSKDKITNHMTFFQCYMEVIGLKFSIPQHGCQLPDFSLRSQTFCYTADFSTTFLYMLKTKTFLHIQSHNHQQAP